MNIAKKATLATITAAALLSTAFLTGCNEEAAEPKLGVSPQTFTDSLFAVMKSDRTNYTKLIIQRLGPNKGNFIKPNEHWEDMDEGAPLPAQMFRYGAEGVAEMTDDFTYSLQSLWCINKQNCPSTDTEKEGLEFISANPGQNFYGEEELGGEVRDVLVWLATSPPEEVRAFRESATRERESVLRLR